MVKLRLRRMGRKKRPYYRIVAADSRAPRDGRFIEAIGTYNPLTNPDTVDLQEERIIYWLKNGAQPTRTVRSILSRRGLWLKWDLMRQGADESKIAEEIAKWEVLQLERAKRQEAAEAQAKKKKEKEEKARTEAETPAPAKEVKAEVAEEAPAETEPSKEEQAAEAEPAKEEPAAEVEPAKDAPVEGAAEQPQKEDKAEDSQE